MIRSHVVSNLIFDKADTQKCLNVSDYPDMADLLVISDFLITDYSSCAFDFALTCKPILFAGFDEQEYLANSRQFYSRPLEVEKLFVRSQKELEDKILLLKADDYKYYCQSFNDFYGVNETGSASEIVARYIKSKFENNI